MQTINWKEDYSVGVEQLDKQHQRLIDLINKLLISPRYTEPVGIREINQRYSQFKAAMLF